MGYEKRIVKGIKKSFICMGLPLLFCFPSCGKEEQLKQKMERTAIEYYQVEKNIEEKAELEMEQTVTEQYPTEDSAELEAWSERLYEKYREALYNNDRQREGAFVLSESGWERREEGYYEYIQEGFESRESSDMKNGEWIGRVETEGVLAAQIEEGKVEAMHIALYDVYGWTEYEYFDSGDLVYFSYYGPERGSDLPHYWVDIYDISGSLYGGEIHEWEKKDLTHLKELPVSEREYIRQEYFVTEEHIYAINREEKKLKDVTEAPIRYAFDWLTRTADKAFCGKKMTTEVVSAIRKMASPPYVWSGGFSDIAVSDLNKDGVDDYVVSLIDPESIVYSGKNIWKKEILCLYLSNAEGGYQEKILIGDEFACVYDVYFVKEDILACMNDLYMQRVSEPYRTAYFRFEPETEEFLFIGEMERNREFQFSDSYLHIRGREEGEYTLGEYYEVREKWVEYAENQAYRKDAMYYMETEEGQELLAYCDRIIANPVLENKDKAVNEFMRAVRSLAEDALSVSVSEIIYVGDRIDGSGYSEQVREMKKGKIEVSGKIYYQNPAVVCGRAEAPFLYSDFIIDRKSGKPIYMQDIWYSYFIIDRKSGKPVYIQDIISKEDMLHICRDGMQDEFQRSIDGEEAECYLLWLEKGYENANSRKPKNIYEETGLMINFSMEEWGLSIIFNVKESGKLQRVYLEKEYFMDTPLWEYWEASRLWTAGDE